MANFPTIQPAPVIKRAEFYKLVCIVTNTNGTCSLVGATRTKQFSGPAGRARLLQSFDDMSAANGNGLAGRARRGGRGSVCRRRGATESRSSGDQSSAEFSSRDYSLNSDQPQRVQVTLDIDSDILDWLKAQPTELAARNQQSCPVFMKSTPPLRPSTNRLDDDMPF